MQRCLPSGLLAAALLTFCATIPTAVAGSRSQDALAVRYPSTLRIEGDGPALHLLDRYGDEVPTADALVIVGHATEATAYDHAHRWRTAGAYTCLGVAAASSAVALDAAGGVQDGARAPADYALLGGTFGVAVLGVGTGLALKYDNPREHLGAWVDRPTVESAVAAWNAAMRAPGTPAGGALVFGGSTGPSPTLTEARRRDALAPRLYHLTPDGAVVDGRGDKVSVDRLAIALGDGAWADAYHSRGATDNRRWVPVIILGGTTAGIGAVGTLLGILEHYTAYGQPMEQHRADRLMGVTGSFGALGVVIAGVGVGGSMVAHTWRDAPAFWVHPSVLQPRLDAYNAALLGPPAEATPAATPAASPAVEAPPPPPPAPGTARLRVSPLLGPIIGVTGTF